MVDVEQLEEGTQGTAVAFEWDPVPADWANALRAFYRPYRWAPWLAAPLAAFSVVLLVTDQTVAGLIGLVASVVVVGSPPVQVWLSFSRHPGAGRTMTGIADEASVRMTVADGTGHTRLEWSELSGWTRTSRGFVLRAGSDQAAAVYPVPGRAFRSAEELDRFQRLLERCAVAGK